MSYDSDDSSISEFESNVHLGIPDGTPVSKSDSDTIEISRIGGQPCFPNLSKLPDVSSNLCKLCSQPMELLMQIFAPFPDSYNDRVLYFFSCSTKSCQRKPGSVRTFRCLSRNEKWAKKLNKIKEREAKKNEEKAKELSKLNEQSKVNPFTTPSNAFNDSKNSALSFGANDDSSDDEDDEDEVPKFKRVIEESENEEDDEDESDEDKFNGSLSHLNISKQSWPSQPSYDSHYLATLPEVLPKSNSNNGNEKVVKLEDVKQSLGQSTTNELEEFEKSLGNGMDEDFEHFVKKLSYEPSQCIRYDLGGQPLMFTNKDDIFKSLFNDGKFNLNDVSKCEKCESNRIFECQLTPNVINLCNNNSQEQQEFAAMSEDERKKHLQSLLSKEVNNDKNNTKGEMEWGTILLFVCENDCCLNENNEECNENWKEELVYVQWE